MLARSFLIESSSKLLVTRTGIKAQSSLNLGRIRPLILELLALKLRKFHTFELEYLWSQLVNLDQILCVASLGWGERLHKVLGQIGLCTLDSGERSLPFGLLVYMKLHNVTLPPRNSPLLTSMSVQFLRNNVIVYGIPTAPVLWFSRRFQGMFYFSMESYKTARNTCLFHCTSICRVPLKMFEHWACRLVFKWTLGMLSHIETAFLGPRILVLHPWSLFKYHWITLNNPLEHSVPILGDLGSVDPDQTLQNAASDQGLHCLHTRISIKK